MSPGAATAARRRRRDAGKARCARRWAIEFGSAYDAVPGGAFTMRSARLGRAFLMPRPAGVVDCLKCEKMNAKRRCFYSYQIGPFLSSKTPRRIQILS
jgi:hypothetical protein